MKRIVNDGYDVVEEMLEGYELAHKDTVHLLDNDKRVLVKNKLSDTPKVGVIVGGGTGHEPLFLGYVGEGFADASVMGNVNTSPSPEPCYNSVKAVDQGKGCIFLYGNYQGDVLNFDMAAEMAADDDIRVETVISTDDVASSTEKTDRRGIAGDVPTFKVAGAAAEKGYDLDEVVRVTQKSNDNTYSMGVSLSSSTLPVTGEAIFHMEEGDMEVGMGIHGEPGMGVSKIKSADEIVNELMENILEDSKITDGDNVLVLVNGLGALPLMDQYICYRRVDQILKEKNVNIKISWVGDYSTSMDMVGMSVTLVKLDDELYELLSAPCDTPYMKQ
ncbi:MAG: dihydroxyacetone kinase subunit DhaK [Tetragenococcus halophilus]|uniref:dihydroxyacetone kinase subunit DhaK n=1 Tax=Tetragenococcus halophilus TaxID=51669 RepID=UPI000CC6720D|nr:dihydroxyacetone kinase subunit DhaK [Tetragenococcus halophilus]MCO8290930.1 dihydroxyacetone kinase subunit DhaK [Tetragenococcus halophilus]MCO8293325.1 dihydroxyacetone kinase subunit DhaK [Tetragenococcus halophilus]MCT8309991.1 dihydroxyacetone kinase subunit DhaK [Tetragenococcus halophilus]MDN6127984.1 dihydroxyacetone kinase subunit DhaK [Tetragenococcus halophilus]MDN6724019.1 dihydroxyacetone kinase subunit DhaK [Tetragenococcus halophilus]